MDAATALQKNYLDAIFLRDVKLEIEKDRQSSPGNAMRALALADRVVALSKALMEHRFGRATDLDVWHEAALVAAMAMRIATEGDSSSPYMPPV